MTEYVPDYPGSVTKYVFVESSDTTPADLAQRAYEISKGVMIKETCFGLQITGDETEVEHVIADLRTVDPTHIFVKDRGFPPGDHRRCRANLGGARPGYYGHENEMKLIRFIAKGITTLDDREPASTDQQKRHSEQKTGSNDEPLDIDTFRKIINQES
ncbi:methanogenesis marker 6 protein [Methanosphaerula palustris]|uniref:Methanogenesis marker protein 6 n=1 Tax=Methanosphaerula palustris (strain ATCC BAA-1556 / DSM 19958 / E1-9c) TaxID=521011 RepID=B8GJ64_METPE|nr:methanogenesis marker 6 protein [Methanosphaerula palustris]ACL15637.1 methanogenesis marker protein 6 [Methanosphaerula palustris E1-9c]